MIKRIHRTEAEKIAVLEKIKAATNTGAFLKQAIKAAGIHPATYYSWIKVRGMKPKKARKTSAPALLTLPVNVQNPHPDLSTLGMLCALIEKEVRRLSGVQS
jgi:hypothetical protein